MFNSKHFLQTKTTKLGFEDVGELVVQTGYLTVVQDNRKNREFFNLFEIPFTESRQIFSYDIEIDASVDFTKITYDAKKEKKRDCSKNFLIQKFIKRIRLFLHFIKHIRQYGSEVR